jgi:putative ABC transport system ATP-binding protein
MTSTTNQPENRSQSHSSPPAAPAISATALDKRFTSGKTSAQILFSVSIELAAGELTLISGPSGSGKSTLLAALSGLTRPDAGRVTALGQDLWSLGATALDAFRLQHCGFIFQGFNLFPALTALDQVILPLQYQGMAHKDARARAAETLDAVGLGPRVHLRPAELSGGEKQRVAIARALAKAPTLLFADEPTSALDSGNGQAVAELMRRAAVERGAAVLCVTHDPRLTRYAHRVIHLEDGRITSDERQISA